ncbi:phosphotransferase family protein [Streptodolium elevatio]|uniref:Phosphotransferase n=1 Tax=Streptodolium elevatio TaxID=3157996 RepID=A0ABV3DL21_9ACTN
MWRGSRDNLRLCRRTRVSRRVARLVREFHDLTAGTALAGEHEVVCHNDLSPRNTVYRPVSGSRRPVAFIDWDLAAPGARIDDVAPFGEEDRAVSRPAEQGEQGN